MVRNPPALDWVQETQEVWVWSLGWEDLREWEIATCSVFLLGKLQSQRSLVGCTWSQSRTWLSGWAHKLWHTMTPQSTHEAEACQYHWILCMYCSPCCWVTNHPRSEFCRMAEIHADGSKSLWVTCSLSLCIQLKAKLGWTIKNDPCSPGCGSEQLPVNTQAFLIAWQLSTKWEEA